MYDPWGSASGRDSLVSNLYLCLDHRFRYRTTRSLRNNSENNNTRSETQPHPEVTLHPAASRQSRSEGWGNEATTGRRSRHTRTRIRGIDKRRYSVGRDLGITCRGSWNYLQGLVV